MRVLLITHFFPPERTAGTEKLTAGYAVELMKLGHHVQVLCAGDWEKGDHYWNGFTDDIYEGIPLRRVHLNWTLGANPNRYLYDNPIVEAHVLNWLTEWQPDIVHLTSCITLSASVIRAAKIRQLPVVFTFTDFWSICPRINLLRYDKSLCSRRTSSWECLQCLMWETKAYRILRSIFSETILCKVLTLLSKTAFISRLRGFRGMLLNMDERKTILPEIISSVDCLIAPSTFLEKLIRSNGALTKSIRVIYYGHDLSWLQTMPERTYSTTLRFAYIGQLIPSKGLDLLITAFLSAGIESRAQLLIYGDANADPRYARTIKGVAEGNDSVRFMGAFPHQRLGEVFSNIDILVVPSQWHENNPLVVQEAYAARTPVLASNVGGISEFVKHEKNGLLFKRDSIDELVGLFRRVASDPSIIGRLQAGIQPPRTKKEEVNDLLQVYSELLHI
jgi:glycosyltransferase involved in cell wall biosynthesis